MACSYCAQEGHNIQTCSRVRRCSFCSGRGHDRRNCPKLHVLPNAPRLGTSVQEPLLAHLCLRPEREHYFKANLDNRMEGPADWLLVATPGHGVGKPSRLSLNFFAVDELFTEKREEAVKNRGWKHGILLKRSAIQKIADRDGHELVEVTPAHPHGLGVDNEEHFWRFDVPNHRFAALDVLSHATVVRLAISSEAATPKVWVPRDAIVEAW